MYLLALALAPVIFLMTYFYLQDRYEREPIRYMFVAFLLGAVTIPPVILLELYFDKHSGLPVHELWGMLVYALLGVALIEEGFKFMMLRLFLYRRKFFNEPFDGIVYSVSVSMGFAAVENVMYVWENGAGTGLLRMFTAVPGHAMFGVLMGYFVGLAKFRRSSLVAALFMLMGLLAAIIPHALYDFFLFKVHSYPWFIAMAAIVLLVALFLSVRSIRMHVRSSPFRIQDQREDEV